MRQLLMRQLLMLLAVAEFSGAQRCKIVSLPGQPVSRTQFAQYSGYLSGRPGNHMFYWLVESSDAPAELAPLVLWLNGGPGCSSLGGLLTTNGPFLVNDRAQLVPNPWAWNRAASILYLESPADVGFSYSDTQPTQQQQNSGWWNDRGTTRDNLLALRHFMRLFPEFSGRDFYLTGESYAGVYLPLLAEAILADDQLTTASRASGLNLRGVAIGNGYFMGRAAMMAARAEFAFLMGLVPLGEHPEIGDPTFNEYNVESLCHHNILGYNDSYRCLNTTAMENYLQRPAVRAALGVSPRTRRYHICSGLVFASYEFRNESLARQLSLLNASGVDVMLYNGNLDYLLPYMATLMFVDNITWPEFGRRSSWNYCQCMFGAPSIQVGGAETRFVWSTIRYRSVLGAGHSAPIEKPEASYQLFLDFLTPHSAVQNCKSMACGDAASPAAGGGGKLCPVVLLLLLLASWLA